MYVQPFQPAPTAANVNALAGWMMNPNPSSSIQPPALVASSMPGPPHQGIVVLLSCILEKFWQAYENEYMHVFYIDVLM